MADTKLRMMVLALLAVMIGCGGKGEDPQSRMKRYAPKDAVVVIYLDVSAAREGLADVVKKHPKEAKQIDLDGFMGVLEKIDAVALYLMGAEGQSPRVLVIHGEVRPGDLTDVLAKMLGAPELAESKLTSKGNGRYKLGEAPILIVDAREADDLGGNVIVAGKSETLTAGLVGALGKGQSPAVTLALKKADTSAMLWGGMALGKPLDASGPKSGAFSANLTGDKLFRGEMTFASEEAAIQAEKGVGMGLELLGPLLTVKRSGATLTIESTKGGNLADMLIPGIRKAIEEHDETQCVVNLVFIGQRCSMYADKNGKLPESLKAMVDEDVLSRTVLQCPSDSSRRACSYLYVAPSPEAPGETLMLCDLKGNHDQIRNVAFKNGAAKAISEAEFQAALKLPRNAKFAAALEKAGG